MRCFYDHADGRAHGPGYRPGVRTDIYDKQGFQIAGGCMNHVDVRQNALFV